MTKVTKLLMMPRKRKMMKSMEVNSLLLL